MISLFYRDIAYTQFKEVKGNCISAVLSMYILSSTVKSFQKIAKLNNKGKILTLLIVSRKIVSSQEKNCRQNNEQGPFRCELQFESTLVLGGVHSKVTY